jgi:hydrogenase maturation protease
MKYLIGLGNYLMFDDSIGIRIIEHVVDSEMDNDFRALDVSGNSLNILSYLDENTEKIVIVDTANMGEEAGNYRLFTLDEVDSTKPITGITSHEDDMIQVLRFARENGYHLPEIVFMGIEPEAVRMDYGMSEILEKRFGEYVSTAVAELNR